MQQVAIAIDVKRLKSALKQRPLPTIATIDSIGVRQCESVHCFRQGIIAQMNQKVIVVRHQAVGDRIGCLLCQIAAKLLEEVEIVCPLEENSLPPVTPIVEMVVAPWH